MIDKAQIEVAIIGTDTVLLVTSVPAAQQIADDYGRRVQLHRDGQWLGDLVPYDRRESSPINPSNPHKFCKDDSEPV